MNDNEYWSGFWITIVTGVVLVLGMATGYWAYQNKLVHQEISGGIDPLQAACAHNTQPMNTKCSNNKED